MCNWTESPICGRRYFFFAVIGVAGMVFFPDRVHAQPCTSISRRETPTLLSDLRLSDGLIDNVTGVRARFSRPSVTFMPDGAAVLPDVPRFERFAVATGYEWHPPEVLTDELVPIAVTGGKLFATDRLGGIHISDDGETFVRTGVLPDDERVYLGSAHGTPAGTLLVATGRGYAVPPNGKLWRSDDEGRTFTQVLAFRVGTAAHWCWASLGDSIFVSEYGQRSATGDGNARQIFRSDDDGRTWQLVYDPPAQADAHPHQILADTWSGCVFQTWGDVDEKIIRTCDRGRTWEWIHDYYQPTGGIVRQEGLYWGHEGIGVPGVQRYDRETGRFTHVFRPWFFEPGGNIKSMIEFGSVMYVPLNRDRQAIWASVDGDHWTFLHGPFGESDGTGIHRLVGHYRGWIHGHYEKGALNDPDHAYLRFRPGRVVTIGGIVIEPTVNNLLLTEQASSAEFGSDGWEAFSDTVLTWDESRSYHGRASIRVDSPDANPHVKFPSLPHAMPPGTFLQAQFRLLGDERTLRVRLIDELGGPDGDWLPASPFDEWTIANCALTVSNPDNRIRLELGTTQIVNHPITFWLDAYQITEAQTGHTWVTGGEPRRGEVLRCDVPFGAEWTDFLCFYPEFNSVEGDDRPRTIKAWVEDPDDYVQLVFDPSDKMLKLVEVLAGTTQVLCQDGPVGFRSGWVFRVALRSTLDASGFEVRIGTAVDSGASGPPLSIQPTESWIGSSPAGDDQAPGIYALSRVFGSALSTDELESELRFLCDFGDYDCDGDVDLRDVSHFQNDFTGAGGVIHYSAFDSDTDRDVDLLDWKTLRGRLER